MITLHPFQQTVVEQIEKEIEAGQRKLLVVAATGSGKTVIGGAAINRAVERRQQRVLVIAHTREIVTQTRDKLVANGVTPGTILAGCEDDLRPYAPVQVASIQTLHARAIRSNRMPMPAATYLIIDEAHHARAKTYQAVLDLYPDAVVIGLTATPCRGDGRGLGNIFDKIIEAPQVAELIAGGYLVGSKIYAPVDRDIAKNVGTLKTGDYVVSQLSARMNTTQLVGDVVSDWLKHGERRKTVAFATDVAHSVHIKNEFVNAGVRCEHLDGSTPKDERDAILARLKSGETEVVSNCAVLTEGWDCPEVGCCILARPTRQMGLFRQMVGRVLRPADGKTDAIILDHAGAVYNHGRPEDHIIWTLDVDRRAVNPTQERRVRGEEPKLSECPQCQAVMSAPPCGNCGWKPETHARAIDFEDGELGLVVNGKANAQAYTLEQKSEWYRMLVGEALRRGKSPGWAWYLFKDKFGNEPPRHWPRTASQPTPEVSRFVQSRVIAYAKRREAAA